MRDETAEWLEPMLDALAQDDASTQMLRDLMKQASMPGVEADDPLVDWLEREFPQATHRAHDWIRFGQLLRERLGWDDYPDQPEGED